MREARGRGRESELQWGGGWTKERFGYLKICAKGGVECLCASSEG